MESPFIDIDIDIDFLAKETLALSEALKGSEEFGQPSLFSNDFSFERREQLVPDPVSASTVAEKAVEDSPFPNTTGLIFKIDSGVNTFCVRGVVTNDISETLSEVMSSNTQLSKRLKIKSQADLGEVHYFETDCIEHAEMISEYIVNKRLPVHEEMVCNISDPGFSWWFESSDSGLKVFFKAQSVERNEDFLRLGPIGDRMIASEMFSNSEALLRKLFSIAEYSSTESCFELRPAGLGNENFQNLRDIFESGQFNFDFSSLELSSQEKRLVLFLKEIAAVRGFWISVTDILYNKA